MIKIIVDGVTKNVPPPAVFEPVLNPLQLTADRNANGRMLRQTLPDKWSLVFEWEFTTPQEFYAWFAYLKTLTRIDFIVRFPSPAGTTEQAEFYISPISARMLSFHGGTAGQWKALKCTFIEV